MMQFATRLRLGVLPVLALFLALAMLVTVPGAARADGYVYTHYQKNMAFGNDAERRLANDILARMPDAVTLQEVNRDNDKLLRMLADAYPSQQFCSSDKIGGVAVASRWPLIPGTAQCLGRLGTAAIQVQMPDGPVWVFSIHLETHDKPYHTRQAKRLAARLERFNGPIILGGDFNDLPTSQVVRTIARSARVIRIGDAITTVRAAGFFGVPIDFVLATGGHGTVEQLPYIGSDHYGVWAEFTMKY
jgi:endonuclease/exonuclease/phosphatase (EEP) superfamily protein YafD